ncbi:MAG: non-ribosomal peptide synthetase [Lachnospiraceae bacterium]|nr:non-ribosomal peptide synthetase [Lachnospiraceae bacterium]
MMNTISKRVSADTVKKIRQSFTDSTPEDVLLLMWALTESIYEHNDEVSAYMTYKDKKRYASVTFTDEDTVTDMLKKTVITDKEPEGFYDTDEEHFKELKTVICDEKDGSLNISVEYDNGHNTAFKVDTIFKMYLNLIGQTAADPEKTLKSLDKVSKEDIDGILKLSTGPELKYDKSSTWLDLFKEWVLKTPDALAVSADNGTYTYKELDEASDKMALYLLKKGAKEGDFIILIPDRVKEFVAAAAGIHKAGCAYVPVDPAYPKERVDFMIGDSGAHIMLTMKEINEALYEDTVTDSDKSSYTIPGAKPEDKAYMIYTSGSTGYPKGVMIAQSALITYSLSKSTLAGIRSDDRIIGHRTFSFDAHIEDYYPTLISGASVFILGEDKRRDSDEIVGFIRENNITGGGFTTTVARVLMTQYELPMRYIIAGGEALYDITGIPSMQIVNEYGPTECTDDCTWFDLETGVHYDKVPIGRPMPNMRCLILDRHSKLLPPGVSGELCVIGPQVAIGYHNREELNRKAFTECPYIPGQRMYHTGDLARYNEDGLIEYMGRIGNQVKLRGYRIELGEIETVGSKYEGIEDAVASVSEVGPGRHLVFYYTVKDGAVADESRLREYMDDSRLPDFMKPEFYMKLDKMPRLPNGKIDRRHMPIPDIDMDIINEPPATALETHMLEVARKILPGIEFGVTDDLFRLGMTSISDMKFVSEINTLEYGLKFRVTDVMRYGNIRGLIEGNRRVFWNYAGYDKDKPMLVFVYGVAPAARTLQMLKVFAKAFNIFIIEQTDCHYDQLFKDADYAELNDMYLNILENHLPEGCKKIDGLMGFSWGGYVAYTLAASWAKKHTEKPFVLMGDADFADVLSKERRKEMTAADFPDNFYELWGRQITLNEIIRKTNMVGKFNSTVSEAPEYDGKVIQLNALKIPEDEREKNKNNLEVIAYHASNLTVIDFPEHTHEDLFYDDGQTESYLRIMLDALK